MSVPQDGAVQAKAKKIRFSIGTKLVSLVASLLIISIIALVYFSTRLFIEDNTALIQQMNSDKAISLSIQMRETFEAITERMRIMGMLALQAESSVPAPVAAAGTEVALPPVDLAKENREKVIQEVFAKDKDFIALQLYARSEDGKYSLKQGSLSPEYAAGGGSAIAVEASDLERVGKGEVVISTTVAADSSPLVVLSIPFMKDAVKEDVFTHTLSAAIRQSKFVKVFSESDIVTSFMVDGQGKLLAHPDSSRVGAGENLSGLEIVRQMLSGKFNNGQTRYVDPVTKEPQLGAFRLVGFGGLGVVTEVAEAKAFEAAKRVEFRSTLIAGIILCVAFLAGYLYSKSITWPIRILMHASHRISSGDFKIALKPKGNDEIAHLSLAFNEMAKGLEERDKVKATFAKFHSKEVAEKVLSGELNLGGERKSATVFFSDVRGFTAMGERMDPEALVKVLNRYMTRMVRVILAHGGIVDKYVGDAIMALWGVPFSKEGDTEQAVRACLGMRQALAELNEELIAEGLPALKIGMGLNFGPLVSGNIGSEERMEYTVIGDTVNTASRIESLTKEFGTDFLMSQEVLNQVSGKFIAEKAHEAKVKGKAEPLVIYKVHGFIDNGKEVLVQTPYSSYKAEKSDKVVHEEPPKSSPATPPAAPPKAA